jgi:hypothetical protein
VNNVSPRTKFSMFGKTSAIFSASTSIHSATPCHRPSLTRPQPQESEGWLIGSEMMWCARCTIHAPGCGRDQSSAR